jgi:hypothetical protein
LLGLLAAAGTDGQNNAPLYVAIASVAVAAIALLLDGRRTRLSLGIGNLWRLIEQWDHPDMRERRANVARSLLDNPNHRNRISDEGIDVVNTFELLAFLVRSRTLRRKHAWINFSAWAIPWWYVYEPGIRRLQRMDKTLFEDFEWLVTRFVKRDARRRDITREQAIPSETDMREFLEAELALPARLLPPMIQEPTTFLERLRFLLKGDRSRP